MKRAIVLILLIFLAVLFCTAYSEDASGHATTVMKEVNVRQNPDKGAKKAVTISKKGSPVDITDTATDKSGTTWYGVVYHGAKKDYVGWIRGDLLDVSAPPVATIAGDTPEAAYLQVLRNHQPGIAAYEAVQEADTALSREYDATFHGNSPLFIALIDLTGDGQEELLFLCANDHQKGTPYYGETADLYVYGWQNGQAQPLLTVDCIYATGGNGPWYEIYRPFGSTDLYMRYSSNGPGTIARYALDGNNRYSCVTEANCLYTGEEDGTPDSGYYVTVNGVSAKKAEYDRVVQSLAVAQKDMLASTREKTAYPILRVKDISNGLPKN